MTRWFLPFAIFLSAAASLAVELAIVRLGAPYVGQSLLPWSAAIASVLLGLTIGHMLGGIVAPGAGSMPGWAMALYMAGEIIGWPLGPVGGTEAWRVGDSS